MATSGTFTGARGGGGTGPWLTLAWSRIAVDEAGNRSQVRLTLNLVSDYAINFSSSKSGNLHGTAFTYTGGMQGPQTKTLKTLDVWVNHDDDGKKTQNFSATFNIAITWGGSYVSSLSVSGNAVLDDIARASAPTLSSTNFNMGSTITIYTNRASTSFTHTVTYIFGNETVNIAFNATTSATWTVPLTLANQIPSSTAGIGSIVLSTYNGGTLIGQKSIGFTANVPSTIVPTATSLSVSIAGSGRDKTLSKYIQGITKVVASFTAAGTYGSTITSSNIIVRRQSDLADSQTISGTSGTTGNPVSLSGTYYIVGETYDSRGRYAAVSTTITVDAYSPPTITKFTAVRSSPTTTVSNSIIASWSLAASNPTDVSVVGVNNAGTSSTLYTLNDSITGSLSTTRLYTSQSDASSYTYTITITDSFGNVAKAEVKVGTTFVEMTIAKGKGIGVAKVWEQGALDVAGDVYIGGKINGYSLNAVTPFINLLATVRSDGVTELGKYVDLHDITHATQTDYDVRFTATGAGVNGQGTLNIGAKDIQNNGVPVVSSGSNSNGIYIKFYDGTLICHGSVSGYTTATGVQAKLQTFPYSFVGGTPNVIATLDTFAGRFADWYVYNRATNGFTMYINSPYDSSVVSFPWIAIGRWV